MPNVTIEVRKRYTKVEEEAIIDAVHAALMEGIKTPEWDRTIRLIVHEPHRFATPPQKDERYTLVDVDLFSADHVKVLLRESAAENWGVRGGVPASEVDLGFKVDV